MSEITPTRMYHRSVPVAALRFSAQPTGAS